MNKKEFYNSHSFDEILAGIICNYPKNKISFKKDYALIHKTFFDLKKKYDILDFLVFDLSSNFPRSEAIDRGFCYLQNEGFLLVNNHSKEPVYIFKLEIIPYFNYYLRKKFTYQQLENLIYLSLDVQKILQPLTIPKNNKNAKKA
ncbi:MAG: hypothetical protein AB1571_04020 [Nanoarchaeota archaeon]